MTINEYHWKSPGDIIGLFGLVSIFFLHWKANCMSGTVILCWAQWKSESCARLSWSFFFIKKELKMREYGRSKPIAWVGLKWDVTRPKKIICSSDPTITWLPKNEKGMPCTLVRALKAKDKVYQYSSSCHWKRLKKLVFFFVFFSFQACMQASKQKRKLLGTSMHILIK